MTLTYELDPNRVKMNHHANKMQSETTDFAPSADTLQTRPNNDTRLVPTGARRL